MDSVIKTNYVLNLFDNSLTDIDRNAFIEDTDEEERFIVYISTVADMIKHNKCNIDIISIEYNNLGLTDFYPWDILYNLINRIIEARSIENIISKVLLIDELVIENNLTGFLKIPIYYSLLNTLSKTRSVLEDRALSSKLMEYVNISNIYEIDQAIAKLVDCINV